MNRINLVLIAVIIGLVSAGHVIKHECHHDKLAESIEDKIVKIDLDEHERHMASTTPRNMVITYDFTYFNSLPVSTANTAFKANVEKALQIAIKYFSALLTIVPRTPYMKFDLPQTSCGNVVVPAADKVLGRDTDLHLYVAYVNDSTGTYLANAGGCRIVPPLGATHGQVNFNLAQMQKSTYNFSDPHQFQDLLEIVIHELTHVLGFSGSEIKFWVDATKKTYATPTTTTTIRGYLTTIVTTPNVLAAARSHFGCTTLAGMPLENQGGVGSIGSHWETTALFGDIMVAAISSTQGAFSKLTTALLRDTGYYTSVNAALEEPVMFGKGAGCNFVTGSCSTAAGSGFCATGSQVCDDNAYAVGYCSNSSFTDTGCNIVFSYGNSKCFDGSNNFLNSPGYVSLLGVGFGNNSKCFMSNVTNSATQSISKQGLCYNSVCNADGSLTVKVAGKDFVCKTNGQVITGVAGTYGTFECPPNIAKVCGAKKLCTNQCSTKGYCSNGTCRCLSGVNGADCA